MIDNPDGTRRLPTKEEILQGVRDRQRQSTLQSNGSSIKTAIRPDNDTATENRRFDNPRPGPSYESNGRDSTNESNAGSGNSTNDGFREQAGRAGNGYSSIDEYQQRAATSSGTTATTEPEQQRAFRPLRKSVFTPYTQAIKESLTSRQKKKADAPKTKTKVFTEAEAKTSRDKLIKVLRWQSDHADEFIIATVRGHKSTFYAMYPLGIWSNMDDEELAICADFLLSRAKLNPRVAAAVRELVILEERLQLAIIIVPRMYKTIMLYLQKGFSIH